LRRRYCYVFQNFRSASLPGRSRGTLERGRPRKGILIIDRCGERIRRAEEAVFVKIQRGRARETRRNRHGSLTMALSLKTLSRLAGCQRRQRASSGCERSLGKRALSVDLRWLPAENPTARQGSSVCSTRSDVYLVQLLDILM
jgi:hypothetical protein